MSIKTPNMSTRWHFQVRIPAAISSVDGVGLQFSPVLLNHRLFDENPDQK